MFCVVSDYSNSRLKEKQKQTKKKRKEKENLTENV